MFEMFNDRLRSEPGIVNIGQWPVIKKQIRENVHKVKYMYRQYQPAVDNQHPLIKFIGNFTVPMDIHVERYVDRIQQQAEELAKTHGFTSLLGAGKSHSNCFYKNTIEYILCHSAFFDPYAFEADWQFQIPVRPLSHPITAMDYIQPGNRCVSPMFDYSVTLLDPVKLMLMYRCYVRSFKASSPDKATSINSFLGGYVLPNMLPHHVDITLINRLALKIKGIDTKVCDITDQSLKHQFTLVDITIGLEHVLQKMVFNTTQSNPSLYKAMRNTFLVYNNDMYSLCKESYITRTKQADWLIALSKLKYIAYLYEACGDNLLNTNRGDVTNAANALVRNDAARIIISMLRIQPVVKNNVMDILNYISDCSESSRLAAQLK
jgi:hypothetical protein